MPHKVESLPKKMLRGREKNIEAKFEASEISHVKRRLEAVISENRQLRTRITQDMLKETLIKWICF